MSKREKDTRSFSIPPNLGVVGGGVVGVLIQPFVASWRRTAQSSLNMENKERKRWRGKVGGRDPP